MRHICDGALPQKAFTLIELLVAIAVLAILVVLMAQLINATGHTIRLSNQLSDTSDQSRLAFDRIGLDLASAIKRPDVDFETQGSRNQIC